MGAITARSLWHMACNWPLPMDMNQVSVLPARPKQLGFGGLRVTIDEAPRARTPRGQFQALLVRLDNTEYAIAASDVHNIVSYAKLVGAEQDTRPVRSVLGANPLALIDLKHRFGAGHVAVELSTPVVVVRIEGREVGLLVDRVVGTISLDSMRLTPADSVIGCPRYVSGLAQVGARSILVLDVEFVCEPRCNDGVDVPA